MPASTTSGTMKINCRGKSRRGGCVMGDDDILNRVARVGSSERERKREKKEIRKRERASRREIAHEKQ